MVFNHSNRILTKALGQDPRKGVRSYTKSCTFSLVTDTYYKVSVQKMIIYSVLTAFMAIC